ncbi:MAG: hypothetical protein NTU77_00860 [Actinobacteria bacterium]|nr:hypothetical protein [Actinomycetota bacterium]
MPVSSSTHVDLGPSHGVRLVRQRVPMRDGVGLNAAVYVQRAAKAKVPTVAELTPYSIETAHGEGQYFPGRGFAYVVADVGGITQQPWSDGRVVLYGGSDSNGHLEKVGRCAYRCGSIASRGRVVSRDRDR